MGTETPLARYNAAALKTSAEVIRCYSTSFGLACRLPRPAPPAAAS
jgi:hypothetical protein